MTKERAPIPLYSLYLDVHEVVTCYHNIRGLVTDGIWEVYGHIHNEMQHEILRAFKEGE